MHVIVVGVYRTIGESYVVLIRVVVCDIDDI